MLPAFETERLLIRPRTMADFAACIAMVRDPELTKYIPGMHGSSPCKRYEMTKVDLTHSS